MSGTGLMIFRAGAIMASSGLLFGSIFLLHRDISIVKERIAEPAPPVVTVGNPRNPACNLRIQGDGVDLMALAGSGIWESILECEEEQQRRSALPALPARPDQERET